MPADRLLHPRAGRSHKITMLTDLEYRVWTQYLLSADDFGVMHATSYAIQNDNLHLANRPAKVVKRCLDALVHASLVRQFDHQGQPYVCQLDWQSWQKVDYPRATINPAPDAPTMALCDESTRVLFEKHPGGQRKPSRGKDAANDSAHASRMSPEDAPTTRAHGRAKRLTANGQRLPANGSEGEAGEPFVYPDGLHRLKHTYPAGAVTGGYLTESAFYDAISQAPEGPADAFAAMLANLETQKAGHQWRVKRMIPRMDRWLREGLWRQVHEAEAPATEQLAPKTNRTMQAATELMAETAEERARVAR